MICVMQGLKKIQIQRQTQKQIQRQMAGSHCTLPTPPPPPCLHVHSFKSSATASCPSLILRTFVWLGFLPYPDLDIDNFDNNLLKMKSSPVHHPSKAGLDPGHPGRVVQRSTKPVHGSCECQRLSNSYILRRRRRCHHGGTNKQRTRKERASQPIALAMRWILEG